MFLKDLTAPKTPQGELEHRRVKRFYRRTNKSENHGLQIGKKVQRAHALTRMAAHVDMTENKDDQELGPASPNEHAQISMEATSRNRVNLDEYLAKFDGDPAYEVCGVE